MTTEPLNTLTTRQILAVINQELGREPRTIEGLREILSLWREVAGNVDRQNSYDELLRGIGRIAGKTITQDEEAADALLRIEEFTSRIQGHVSGLTEVSDSLRAAIQEGETSNEAIRSVLSLLEGLQSAVSDLRQAGRHQEGA